MIQTKKLFTKLKTLKLSRIYPRCKKGNRKDKSRNDRNRKYINRSNGETPD